MSKVQNVSMEPHDCEPSPNATSKAPQPIGRLAYDVEETAALLSLGRTSIYGLVQIGRLRATKIGRRTVFLASDIMAFLADLQGEDAQ